MSIIWIFVPQIPDQRKLSHMVSEPAPSVVHSRSATPAFNKPPVQKSAAYSKMDTVSMNLIISLANNQVMYSV